MVFVYFAFWILQEEFSTEKDSSAPRHFGTVEKKCQIGTAFSFKYKLGKNWQTRAWDPVFKTAGLIVSYIELFI
jgi:hypothetical protein